MRNVFQHEIHTDVQARTSLTLDAISRLDRDVSTALATIRERRNSFVCVNRIPLEVLSLIPVHLPSQKDRFRVSSVCRHWRRTFLQHGALWSQLFPEKGEAYTKTLLGRAGGSPLDIIIGPNAPVETRAMLYPRARQIKHLQFIRSRWTDIREFSESVSGPLPLLRTLKIAPVEPYEAHGGQPDASIPAPSLPFFRTAVNLEEFTFHSELFWFLGYFAFPNLTTFELATAPEVDFNASGLLDFLTASPMLRTVQIRVLADAVLMEGTRQESIVALPKVETFSLTVSIGTIFYDIATHISCPRARKTLLQREIDENGIATGLEIFPCSVSWNAIVHQYTRSPVEEISLEIEIHPDPHLTGYLTFRSFDMTVITLAFQVSNTCEDVEDLEVVIEELGCEVFGQASRIIRDHPLISEVKVLQIKYADAFSQDDCLRRAADEFGRLFKSLGPLDALSIHSHDPRSYLAPFLGDDEFDGTEYPIVYPPIKDLKILDPWMIFSKVECLAAIVTFAQSQHERGVPFESVTLCIRDLPVEIVEKLRQWVRTVVCEELR